MGLFAATAALPWSIAVGQDVRQPTCDARQNVAQAVTNSWARELTRLAVHGNARAAEVLTGIYHLMAAPTTMLHPALFGRHCEPRSSGTALRTLGRRGSTRWSTRSRAG